MWWWAQYKGAPMRIDPRNAGVYSAGAFLFLLVFGLGWPGPGMWLLVFALAFLAAAAAAWFFDNEAITSKSRNVAFAHSTTSPFDTIGRRMSAPNQRFDRGAHSRLLALGLPGPDINGRWAFPAQVHITLIAGLIGLLAMIIFISASVTGSTSDEIAKVPISQSNPAIDFALSATPRQQVTTPKIGEQPNTILATIPEPILVETPESTRPMPAKPVNAPITSMEPSQTIIHDVIAGDTIYDLALTHNTSIDAIMKLNGIDQFDTIRVGDRLLIPSGGA